MVFALTQSIDGFMRHPSLPMMSDILDRFVRPGSVLEVNIDFETRCVGVQLMSLPKQSLTRGFRQGFGVGRSKQGRFSH